MSKIITLSNISTFWNNVKEYFPPFEKNGDGTKFLSDDGTYKIPLESSIPTKTSELTNDSEFVAKSEIASINGQPLTNGGNLIIGGGEGGTTTIIFDSTPTTGSQNAVTSDGIYNSIESLKEDIIDGSIIAAKSVVADRLQTYELFSDSAGNFSNITLSDTCANYTMFDVFGITDDGIDVFIRINNPSGNNGKKFVMLHNYLYGGGVMMKTKTYQINGNSIYPINANNGSVQITTNDKHIIEMTDAVIGITSVLGYK